MDRTAVLTVGIVVERREKRWHERPQWAPWAVVSAQDSDGRWRLLRSGGGRCVFHAGICALVLHRGETAAYRRNFTSGRPAVHVVLRSVPASPPSRAVTPFHATLSLDEATAFAEGGDIVGSVPMPAFVAEWASRYLEAQDQSLGRDRGVDALAPALLGGRAAIPVARPAWRVAGNDA